MNWYYRDNDQRVGPIDESGWSDLVTSGKIKTDTLVWHDGMAEWLPYARVDLAPSQTAPTAENVAAIAGATGVCTECGRTLPAADLIRFENSLVCASCKPAFFQKVTEGVAVRSEFVYAGFWIRVAAKFIDIIILVVINQLIGLITGAIFPPSADGQPSAAAVVVNLVLQLAAGVSYQCYFLGQFSATPGKMVCGLRVLTTDGLAISYARACGRYFAEMLSGFILGIGYLMVAFDPEKRGLHDRICDTRVVRK